MLVFFFSGCRASFFFETDAEASPHFLSFSIFSNHHRSPPKHSSSSSFLSGLPDPQRHLRTSDRQRQDTAAGAGEEAGARWRARRRGLRLALGRRRRFGCRAAGPRQPRGQGLGFFRRRRAPAGCQGRGHGDRGRGGGAEERDGERRPRQGGARREDQARVPGRGRRRPRQSVGEGCRARVGRLGATAAVEGDARWRRRRRQQQQQFLRRRLRRRGPPAAEDPGRRRGRQGRDRRDPRDRRQAVRRGVPQG